MAAVPAGPEGHARQKYTVIVHRVLGLTNARLVNLRNSNCLSFQVWQAPTIAGRATVLGATNEVDRATNPILEGTLQSLNG